MLAPRWRIVDFDPRPYYPALVRRNASLQTLIAGVRADTNQQIDIAKAPRNNALVCCVGERNVQAMNRHHGRRPEEATQGYAER
jgi:hypothetical protein